MVSIPVRAFKSGLVLVLLLTLGSLQGFAVTKVVGAGQMLLMRDSKEAQYGAVKVEKIDPRNGRLVYRWFMLPEGVFDLASPQVESGTVVVRQVQSRAVVAFGPFVLEWHGSAQAKGIFSSHGNLGTQPLFIASSGIHEATRIHDVRQSYQYEMATPRESPSPLGLTETFSDLPKARLGLGVEETFVNDPTGAQIPAIRISRVDENSKAFAAGVRENQELVTFDGKEVFSAADFRDLLKGIKPDDTVRLKLLDNGKESEISFQAEQRVPVLSAQPTPVLDPNLPPEERDRIEKNQEVLHVMQEAIEALRAVHFD
jgi:hypothetical protein